MIAKIILLINKIPIHISLAVNTFSKSGLEIVVAPGDQEEMVNVSSVSPNITLLDVKRLIHEQEVSVRVTTPPETCQLFREIAESLTGHEPTFPRSQSINNDLVPPHLVFVYKSRDLLLTHWQEPPSLKQLAHQVATNPNKLSKVFRRTFGMTVFDYLREYRLAKAQDLLRQSIFSIQQIAYTVGYQNHSAFTAVFKQRFGLTPRQYRQASNCDANDRN